MNNKTYKREQVSWFRREHSNRLLIIMLIFVCPLGLYLMWTKECEWKLWIKSAVSAAFAILLALIVLLLPELPNAELEGNVEIIILDKNKGKYAPFQPEGVPETAQILKNGGENSTLITNPTATPEPIWVYSNDNGLYYHTKECRYVHDKTPRVTLRQALEGGRQACRECNPPDELT